MRQLALCLSILVLASDIAVAHDPVRDPVCGMMIEPENAAANADYLGKTWYFCQAKEREQFLANPAKYVSARRLQQKVAAGLFIVSVDPGEPTAGTEVRLRAILAPSTGEVVEETAPIELRAPVVHFYEVDRDRPSRETVVRLQPLSGNAYGTLRLAARTGETRFVVEASTAEGSPLSLTGSFTTRAHVETAFPDEPFTMARQHEVMRRFGRRWQDIRIELEKDKPDFAGITHSVALIESERKRLPLFELHVNGDAKEEFVRYGEDLKGPLAELGAMAARGDWEAAKGKQRQLETESCVKCHLKFRWDAVRDLSRFPRVEGTR